MIDWDDETQAVTAEWIGAPVTVVAFGGLARKFGMMPPFEFMAQLPENVNRIFLRDLHQCWYQRGLDGESNLDRVVHTVEEIIAGRSKTLVIGNSAGGYAAIYTAAVLGLRCLAFSPQTFITQAKREQAGDFRWPDEAADAEKHREGAGDLAMELLRRPGRAKIDVWYGKENAEDVGHAWNIALWATLHPVWSPFHNVVRGMRDTGQLAEVIDEALSSLLGDRSRV